MNSGKYPATSIALQRLSDGEDVLITGEGDLWARSDALLNAWEVRGRRVKVKYKVTWANGDSYTAEVNTPGNHSQG